MCCIARFGTICITLKTWKAPTEQVLPNHARLLILWACYGVVKLRFNSSDTEHGIFKIWKRNDYLFDQLKIDYGLIFLTMVALKRTIQYSTWPVFTCSKSTIANTKTMYEISSKLTIITTQRCHWRRSGVFIVNFELISHIILTFPLLTLNKS